MHERLLYTQVQPLNIIITQPLNIIKLPQK